MAKQTALATQTQKPLAISQQPAPCSLDWAVRKLTWLATARQASVSEDTLTLYASELEGRREDEVSIVIRKLAVQPRGEYQTAFPDLGTILFDLGRIERIREVEEEQAARREELRQLRADRDAHPAKYVGLNEIVSNVMAKRNGNALS